MKILSLELRGFRRLLLNSIEYIKLTPDSKIQLILGSNGSGKSSLLKELSPLPAIPAEFTKDGFKIIEISHNNSHYLLKSLMGTSNKFLFIKDGEELNPGGTSSVYKELVKQEFNLDQNVVDLLMGISRFHMMSVSERRSWFTRMSDANYTYAIGFYQRLKEQLRDMQGAIKLNQARLLQESNKLLSNEEEQQYLTEISELHQFIACLLESKTTAFTSKDQLMQQLTQIDQRILKLSQLTDNLKADFANEEEFTSTVQLEHALIDTQATIRTLEQFIQQLHEQIEKAQKMVATLARANIDSFDNIDKAIQQLMIERSRLQQLIKLNLPFADATQCHQALTAVTDNLVEIFMQLGVNPNKEYSSQNYTSLLEEYRVLSNTINETEKLLTHLTARKKELEYHKEHHKAECPQCKFSWYQNYDEQSYRKVLAAIDHQHSQLEQANQRKKTLEERIEKTKYYLELYRAYNQITKAWTNLTPLWQHLMESGIIFTTPTQVPNVIVDAKYDLELLIQLQQLEHKLKEHQELKQLLSKNQELDLSKLNLTIEELNKQLYERNSQLQHNRFQLKKFTLYREICRKIHEVDIELHSLLPERERKQEMIYDALKRTALNETIQALQLELSKKEKVIAQVSLQKALVDNLQKQVKEYSEKAEVLKLLVKELSPTEGLIAKGLTGFINHYVKQMNQFIRQVWLYPLELKPILVTSDDELELDYKFAVAVNENNVIPDVIKGSSAIREIIDLAFKVVSLKYLGLQDYPIYLDELGASFDKAHRDAVARLIHSLMTASNYSQVYIISHYSETYGSFKNTDVTVLCENNIALSKDTAFNQHTLIHRN